MTFFSQLFDSPAEIVIAQGRVVLAALSLAAITANPTEPIHLSPLVAAALISYAAYAVVLLAALHRRFIHNVNVLLLHIVDLAVVALLLILTEGFSSPFLVFFTFVLLAASLRWDWQGIAATMVVLVLIAGMVAALDSINGQVPNLHQAVIRGAYLIATGTILTYASAHREHARNRLAKLAQSPTGVSSGTVSGPLAETLKQSVAAMEAARALVVWQEDYRGFKLAIWHGQKFEMTETSAESSDIMVAPEMDGLTFSRTLPDLERLNLANGSSRVMPDVLRGEFMSKLKITDFSSSPFRGLAASGRLFILGNIRPSDDHLSVTQIIANRVGTELDRQIFLERATRDAAMRERAGIMRDLHDSLLQNLTAARTQLEFLPADGEQAKAQLQTVRELLRMEQRRVREFVDATHATDHETVTIELLRPAVEDAAALWGCAVSLHLNPSSATVTRKTLNQLSLMLAESVANAVRHGEASTVDVSVTCHDRRLEIEVRDDGRGFSGIATAAPTEILESELPKSLSARLRGLGGQLRAHTSASGSVLRLELST